jgi:SAM-dependent methyltransferase
MGSAGRGECAAGPTAKANRAWWDAAADEYQVEHGAFLGDSDFCWGPEGLRESEAGLLGPVAGAAVLEIGCGAAQCSRWLVGAGARAVGVDISVAQLRHSRELDRRTASAVPVLAADAAALPLRDGSFDLACSAYGALPFVADAEAVHREVARVLRPGGRWVFSVTHPIRWCFPDDPGPMGLTAGLSYFDRRPYLEFDEAGHPSYVEHHRTVGDWVRQITAAGLTLLDVVEPPWPEDLNRTWGGWSPLRGELIPGTAIFVTGKPG